MMMNMVVIVVIIMIIIIILMMVRLCEVRVDVRRLNVRFALRR